MSVRNGDVPIIAIDGRCDKNISANGAQSTMFPTANRDPPIGYVTGGLAGFVYGKEVVQSANWPMTTPPRIIFHFTDLLTALYENEDLVLANLMTTAVHPGECKFSRLYTHFMDAWGFLSISPNTVSESRAWLM